LIGCRFDPTGRFVFAGSQDNTIQRWELATGKKTTLTGHKSWARGIAFLPGGKTLFTAGYEGRILCWPADAEAPTPLRTIDAHHGWVRAVAVSPDGKLLASCGNDHRVKLLSTVDGKLVRELTGHTCHVYNVAFHPNGQHLASADLKGVVKHWDLAKGTLVRDLDASALHKYDNTFLANIGGIRSMAFSRDGSMLACAGITEVSNAFAGVGKPLVLLFDWATGKRKQGLVPKENFQGTAWGVVIHPTGFVAGVGGGNGGALWFWKPEQAQAFFTLKLPNNARDLDLHPDGHRLAVPFFDGAVRIYDMTAKSAG
jgi:WD40 repeat protein